jgi:hypothetical protein
LRAVLASAEASACEKACTCPEAKAEEKASAAAREATETAGHTVNFAVPHGTMISEAGMGAGLWVPPSDFC